MTTSSDITQTLALEYVRLATGFGDVLDAVAPEQWAAPSPCDGWTARDVVGHVIETQRDFLARHDVDLGESPSLDDPAAAWRAHRTVVGDRLTDPAVGAKPFDGHFGPTTVGETLLRFYGFDMVAHRWDVASAAGRDLRFTDAELEMMETAAAGFGPALYGDGVCKSGVEVPADADRQTRVLAMLGRSA
ncbi:TIGR03086 family protein [Gordonia sp. SID5947]|uniref:TIGR03086 family metal-binding protein n=1 Tax=Gordonia sp. SID5947 TaxID=2690315 RepID=UPI00136D2A26|nr:TIGR03086 family metal-binding protein [Gordonia sp. SID5947]MYR07845.1 TIGR03086 family protein [Gordonia sp. SID5947]